MTSKMVPTKSLVTVAMVASLLGVVQPYSSGPPTSVCVGMMPNHGVQAQGSQSPYSIEVDTNTYTVFSLVHVTIRGDDFKGVMLQARRAAGGDTEPLGSFFNLPSTLGTLSCQDDDDTLVHTSSVSKGQVTFTWAASSVYGSVQFVATIVQERRTFWTSVTSQTVSHFTGGVITNPAVPAVSCTRPVDLLFIVDSSDVMLERVALHGQNWDLLTDFLESFVSDWGNVGPTTTNVAVMTYGATVRVDIELNGQWGLEDVLDAIRTLPKSTGGDVQLESALTSARDVFRPGGNSRGGVPNIACLIMGEDPDNIDNVVTASENLQNDDVILNVIGATLKAKRSTVRRLLINPLFNYNYWLTVGFESLPSVRRSLTLSLSDQMECEPESIVVGPPGPGGSTGATGGIIPDRPDVADQPELPCPVDVAILLDSSGSICNNKGGVTTCNNWELIKEFARELAKLLLSHPDPQYRARIAIIRFSLNVYPDVSLTDYTSYTTELENKISNLPYANSWTNTPEAFKTVKDSVFTTAGGDREDAPNIVIILTDGQPKISGVEQAVFIQQTIDAAQELKDDDVNIFSIGVTYTGVTDFISESVLKGISSPPQRLNVNYWKARDFDSLAVILSDVSNYICSPNPTDPCTTDVVFVLDYSSSLGPVVYGQITQFVSAIIQKMDLEKTTRVGLVVFSDDDTLGFNLNEYQSNGAAAQAVLDVRYVGGRTNTGAAIEYMRNTMFTSGNGDRSDVDNVAVVITDGGSNVPDKIKVIEESRAAKKQGIHMIAVGIGPWLDVYEINAIASYPASINTRVVPEVDDLPAYVNTLLELICNEDDDCEDNPCQNGGTCVDGFGMYWCQCQSGDAGPDCTKTCREPADIAFAFDVSGSVGRENTQKEIGFLADVINNGLNVNDFSRVAVEDFADSANVRFYLNEYNTNKQVLDGLDFYYGAGSTNTADALAKMDNDIFTSGNGDRGNRPNAGVIITDGKSDDPSATWENARQMRADGTHLISIGVGSDARQSELEAIASYPPESNVFNADDFDSVGIIRDDLIDLLCNNVDDCDPNPCQNSGTCTDLIGGYRCSCRDGFTGTNCERACSGVIDLVFIFDGSRGMRRDRFGKVLEFASNIVGSMTVAADETRVAAILYGEDATVEFQLNTYTSQQDVIAHFKTLKYRRGKSNTAAALRTLIDDVMKDSSVRDDAQKICIIITNAKSNVDKELTLPYATEAMNAGIHMISVGVGNDVDVLEMNGLASRPRTQNVFAAPSWRDLDGLIDGVVGATCDDQDSCNNAFCQNGDCQDGFGTYVCECESDFTGRLCNRRCTSQMDLVFVLDLSGSVDTDYDLITSFTEGVIYGLNMNFGRARIGIVIFSDDADVWVYLDAYTDKEALLNAISFPKTGGKTKTEIALGLLRTDVFINSAGDRPGVANRAVIITDGKSNEESLTVEEAKDVRDDGIEIFVVALGGTPRMSEVNAMASDPDSDHVVNLQDTNGLSSAVDELLTQLCQ